MARGFPTDRNTTQTITSCTNAPPFLNNETVIHETYPIVCPFLCLALNERTYDHHLIQVLHQDDYSDFKGRARQPKPKGVRSVRNKAHSPYLPSVRRHGPSSERPRHATMRASRGPETSLAADIRGAGRPQGRGCVCGLCLHPRRR